MRKMFKVIERIYNPFGDEILSPAQISSDYSSDIAGLFTDFDYVDVRWLMNDWFDLVIDDDDWDYFANNSNAYFEPEDHINFIDSVLIKGKK